MKIGHHFLIDPNDWWKFINSLIMKHIEIKCPTEQLVVKEKKDPLISDELLEVIKERDNSPTSL